MPVLKSLHPGVHVFEVASGVNTIAGVSTSVTAFVGAAKRGPVNKATRVLGFADFERRFGGLDQGSELSYAVRQFFLNGGGEAWIVRVALESSAAQLSHRDSALNEVLKFTARDEGEAGNRITTEVDYQTPFPASTFNLTIRYDDPSSPGDNREELFTNLSMNKDDLRYVVDVVNGASELVTASRVSGLSFTKKGESLSGPLLKPDGSTAIDVKDVVKASANQIRVVVDDLPPITVKFTVPLGGADANANREIVRQAIEDQVRAMSDGNPSLQAFQCTIDTNRLKLISGVGGESSRVRVLPAPTADVSAGLFLGSAAGGIETDGAAEFRPRELVTSGRYVGAETGPSDFAALPSATKHQIKIALDGEDAVPVSVGTQPASGDTSSARLRDLAERLQKAVREAKPSSPAFKAFTCRVDESQTKLVLTSGTRSSLSAVAVTEADSNSIASELKLLAGAAQAPGDVRLTGGEATPPQSDMAKAILKSRDDRLGLYALESVDLFNILCLPGVTTSSVLGEAVAYCEERRAFLLIDPPPTATKPDAMEKVVSGTDLPKSDHAAVYYPWLKISDPLKNGKLRSVPPCGTIAGLFARTDSTRGVWKAPAGTEANMLGVQAMDYLLTDPENGVLNPRAVNCLRIFPTYGPVVWGSRTLRGDDNLTSEYKYVPVRRLALYLGESLFRGLKWVVFEPNDEPLWAQIRLNVGAFLQTLFRQGAFQGMSPREAYFVKCDAETTTQTDINLGRVNIVVGFAPLKPAEFVIVTIQQMAGQIAT